MADFLTVTKFLLADFSDSHQICQQIYPPIFLLAEFLTVTRICWQIYSPQYLHGTFLDSHQICWQIYPHPQLLIGRFCDSYHTCWQIYPSKFSWQIFWQSPNLVGRFTHLISACRFSDSHQNLLADLPPPPYLCRQIFLTVTKSGWQIYPQQISVGRLFWQSPHLPADLSPIFLLADFLTVCKSVGRLLLPNFCMADILDSQQIYQQI